MRVEEPQQVKTSTMLLPLTTNASVLEEIRQSFSTMLPWAVKPKTLEERCHVLSIRVSFLIVYFGHIISFFGLLLRTYKRIAFSLRLMWTGSHVGVQIIMQEKWWQTLGDYDSSL